MFYFLSKLLSYFWREVFWPEVLLVTHLHPGLVQHGHGLRVLQPQSGLQEFERLTGELLVYRLDLRLEADEDRQAGTRTSSPRLPANQPDLPTYFQPCQLL